jgi:uncharacterized protein DUF5134
MAGMAGGSWLAGALAGLMIVTAAYSASRLAVSRLRRRATEPDTDALHAAMGAAMAGMLVPQLSVLPGSAWAAVFGVCAAWFGWHAIRSRDPAIPGGTRCRFPVPHLIECIAMLYMLLPVHDSRPPRAGGGMAMAGMGASPGPGSSYPALAIVLAMFMLGYIVWTTDRLTALARARTTTAGPGSSGAPEPAAACLRHADGALSAAAPGTTRHDELASRPPLAPRLAALGKIAMSITMGYMLILML